MVGEASSSTAAQAELRPTGAAALMHFYGDTGNLSALTG